MIISSKVRENLIHLWSSPEKNSQELAFQLLDGIRLSKDDLNWLFGVYQKRYTQNSGYSTLKHHQHISEKEILNGRIFSFILKQEPSLIPDYFWSFYYSDKTLRLPYALTHTIPTYIFEQFSDIQQLIWQDGELESLDESLLLLKHLEVLDVRRQPISQIHPSIALLSQLKEIYLVSASFIPPELAERDDIEFFIDAPY